MPSKLKQINVRVSDDIHERLLALMARMQVRLGIEVSQSDAVRAGILALEKEYPASTTTPRPAASKPVKTRKGG